MAYKQYIQTAYTLLSLLKRGQIAYQFEWLHEQFGYKRNIFWIFYTSAYFTNFGETKKMAELRAEKKQLGTWHGTIKI